MSEVFRFQYRRYRLPFRAAVRTAHGEWREREGVIVRLEDATGAVGWGEAAPIPWFGTETVEEIEEVVRGWNEVVAAEVFEEVPGRLECLRSALAAARSPAPAPCHRRLGVAALLSAGRAALAQIPAKAELGFRVFKWKVGVADLADELALFDDVCAALPNGAKLRLDANGAWERRPAERWLERCAERSVEFVEQPCFAAASEGASRQRKVEDTLLGLAEDFPTPIALDESLVGAGDVERWLGRGWRGVFVIKPALLGAPAAALARLAHAKAAVVFSSALESPVGARTALQLAFAWAGEARSLGFGVWPLFADARFDGPHGAPFLDCSDVDAIEPEAVWNALS